MKGDLNDPKGLIREAYRIEGITAAECRSIFLDWALSVPDAVDTRTLIAEFFAHYSIGAPEHPMTDTLRLGLGDVPQSGRRGGRAGRVKN